MDNGDATFSSPAPTANHGESALVVIGVTDAVDIEGGWMPCSASSVEKSAAGGLKSSGGGGGLVRDELLRWCPRSGVAVEPRAGR